MSKPNSTRPMILAACLPPRLSCAGESILNPGPCRVAVAARRRRLFRSIGNACRETRVEAGKSNPLDMRTQVTAQRLAFTVMRPAATASFLR